MTKSKNDKPSLAGVDDYPERPYDEAKAKDVVREQTDQIPDYHKKHPTLKTNGPENDPAVQEELHAAAPTPEPESQDQ